MGRLADFRKYIADRTEIVGSIELLLGKLQNKYESFYKEVEQVRESELAQLSGHIAADRTKLPDWVNPALDAAQKAVEEEFDVQLKALKDEQKKAAAEAEAVRAGSLTDEKAVRARNVLLDQKEEALKAKSTQLVAQIDRYNGRIHDMGSGFGFFSNFFGMRRLQAERRAIDEEQANVAAQIESVRALWAREEKGHVEKEAERQQKWVEARTSAAELQTKVDYLVEARPRLIFRSTVERVLFQRLPTLAEPKPKDPACPRCKSPNPPANHFCRICAVRLTADRPDFAGSIEEIAEVNLHHQRFSEGMRACQEIIGLVRGLKSGLAAFAKSVDGMIDSENRYPLAKLQLDVPAASVEFGRNFDSFLDVVKQDQGLHPKQFAAKITAVTEKVFTEEKIKGFFETMGEELSRQAKRQWK